MNDVRPEFRAALKLAAAERLSGQGHPGPEELQSYHSGELAAERREEICSHLALCPECVGLVRELDGFLDPLAASMPVPAGEAERSLAAVQARWRETPDSRRTVRELESKGFRIFPAWSAARGPYSLAAALLLAVVALAAERHQLLAPQPNTAFAELQTRLTRGALDTDVPVVRLDSSQRFFHLVIYDPQEERFPAYQVDIASGSKVLATVGGLSRTPYETFNLTLSGRGLPEGKLTARLFGLTGGERSKIAEYDFFLEFH